jgi:long-chain acyl-CoA synthetase
MNIAANLDWAAFHYADHCAVTDGEKSVSFSEFRRDANRMASALVDFGIQPGNHVALCAPNSYEWMVFYFGALKAGAVAVTFSHLLMKEELHRTLTDCEPRILFTADEKLEDLGDYQNAPPELIVSDHDGGIPQPFFTPAEPPGSPKEPC